MLRLIGWAGPNRLLICLDYFGCLLALKQLEPILLHLISDCSRCQDGFEEVVGLRFQLLRLFQVIDLNFKRLELGLRQLIHVFEVQCCVRAIFELSFVVCLHCLAVEVGTVLELFHLLLGCRDARPNRLFSARAILAWRRVDELEVLVWTIFLNFVDLARVVDPFLLAH